MPPSKLFHEPPHEKRNYRLQPLGIAMTGRTNRGGVTCCQLKPTGLQPSLARSRIAPSSSRDEATLRTNCSPLGGAPRMATKPRDLNEKCGTATRFASAAPAAA